MTVWVSVCFAGLACFALPNSVAFAVQWACLWFGFALFYSQARSRFFSFLAEPAPVSLLKAGFTDDELEAPVLAPWYLLPVGGLLWALLAPVGLLAEEPPLMAFGLGIAVVLTGLAALSAQTHKAASFIAQLLVDPAPAGLVRLEGTIVSPDSALRLRRWWFDHSDVQEGAVPVAARSGSEMTPSSDTYGFRHELRQNFRLRSAQGEFTVDVVDAIWAAPTQHLPTSPSMDFLDLPSVRPPAVTGAVASARAWEQEELGMGSNVIVLGKRQGGARLLIESPAGQPLLVFGTDGSEDPTQVLSKALARRQALIFGPLVLAALAMIAALA